MSKSKAELACVRERKRLHVKDRQRKPAARASKPRQNLDRTPNMPGPPTSRSAVGHISSPRNARNIQSKETTIAIGWKRDASCLKKPDCLCTEIFPLGAAIYAINSISGTHSFTFCRSRLIAKGFGRSPCTPASRKSSCARLSSPLAETSTKGGTVFGGSALL
jgi:hypothetical protein